MRFARSIFGLATVLAVALATILGGHRYFYCRPMDRIMTHTKCACAQASADDQTSPSLGVRNDCFEARIVHRLVSFTIGNDLAIPPATLTEILPRDDFGLPGAAALLADGDHPIRAGPFSPTAVRAQLMVFLT